MKYLYKCTNQKCAIIHTEITKSINQSDRAEYCKECGEKMQRSYSVGVKTGDGVKR